MRHSGYNLRGGTLAVLVILLIAGTLTATSQVYFNRPQPGNVYKEYSRIMDRGTNDWRVTDPNIDLNQWPEAASFLPNPSLPLNIDDLSGAVRAEAVISLWGGHIATIGKKVRFNGNDWIDLPELSAMNGIPAGHPVERYMYEVNQTVDIPLSNLVEGTNYIQGTNAGQTPAYGFGWGQHGWYAIMVRVYYDPSTKSHPTGSITSPTSGSTFGENPVVSASVAGGVDRVDFLAYYDGFDTDGDGIFQEYHEDYHVGPSESSMNIHNHVGTASGSPWQVTWNTQWVPDQAAGSVKLLARIRGTNGVWFVTDEVSNLNFSRSGAFVQFYKPQNVPEAYWVKSYIESNSSNFTIPAGHNLGYASDAAFFVRTWNGLNGGSSPPNTAYTLLVNHSGTPSPFPFGESYYYSYNALALDLANLTNGSNLIEWYCNSVGHGIEVLWPGPGVMVRYQGSLPIQLASFAATTVSGHAIRLEWSTVSETNNFGFEVQKSSNGPGNFQSIPGSFVAGHGTTLQPQHYSFVDENGADANTYYRLKQTDLDGTSHFSEAVKAGAHIGAAGELPATFALEQNHPNPFNPSTVIRFALPADGFVSLKVYNVLGQVVRSLVNEQKPAGYYDVTFDATGLTSGVYLYRLESGKFVETKKLLLVK